MSQHDHYFIDVSAYDRVDVYRLIELAGITCPVAQHVFKKAFATGKRGHKDLRRDWQDIADSAARKLRMLDEDNGWTDEAIRAAAFGQQNTFDYRKAEGVESDWPNESRRVDAATWEAGEARMDVVGVNGNDGLHYADGWMEWGGGRIPVSEGVRVDIRFRNGEERLCTEADEWVWGHFSSGADDGDIIAWRLAREDHDE